MPIKRIRRVWTDLATKLESAGGGRKLKTSMRVLQQNDRFDAFVRKVTHPIAHRCGPIHHSLIQFETTRCGISKGYTIYSVIALEFDTWNCAYSAIFHFKKKSSVARFFENDLTQLFYDLDCWLR